MNILVPLNDVTALDAYLATGAQEFYVGFVDNDWTQRFGEQANLNRLSGFGGQANALTFPELLDIARTIAAAGAHIFVPFNTAAYSTAQCDYIAREYFPALAQAGVTGVILSGPEIVEAAANAGLMPVASTMCAIFNSDIAQFYRERGVGRMIFPRELTVAEIRSIVEKIPDIEYEVFLMRNGCVFSDSHCLGCHRSGHYSLCRDLRHAERWQEKHTNQSSSQPAGQFDELFAQGACGLCALWEFEQMGIHSGKIVGRCDDTEDLLRDIRLVRDNIELARQSSSAEAYLAALVPPEGTETICATGLNCYYPEMRRII